MSFLKTQPSADGHAGERRIDRVDREPRLVSKALVKAMEKGAAAHEDEPALHHIGSKLGWGPLERSPDSLDDSIDGPRHRLADLRARQAYPAQVAVTEVTAAQLPFLLLDDRPSRPDRELERFRTVASNEESVSMLGISNDGLVHLVAADAKRLGDRQSAERRDRHLSRPAADVDDHAPDRLGDGKVGADRSSHRFLDQ